MRRFALACVLATLGCQGPTELLLVVQTDLDHDSLAYVEIAIGSDATAHLVTDGDGGSSQPCICVSSTACSGESVDFPLTVPLEPGKQGTVPFQVAALAHLDAGCGDHANVVDSAVLSFVPHERLGVYLSLNRACIGVVCGDDETCDPKSGACMPNITMPVPIQPDPGVDAAVTDLAVGDLSVVPDLTVPPPDLALPPFFELAPISNGDDGFRWDVAAARGNFSLVVLSMGQASYGPVAASFPNATLLPPSDEGTDDYSEVCVSSDSGTFFYGLAASGNVTAYAPTSTGPGAPIYDENGASTNVAISNLACAEDSTGVTLAWLEERFIAGSVPTLTFARKIGGATKTLDLVILADRFAMAKSGTATVLVHPRRGGKGSPLGTERIAPRHGPSDLGAGPVTCDELELYQLFDDADGFVPASPTAAFPSGPPCVELVHSVPFAVAPVTGQVVAGGSTNDETDPPLGLGIPPTFAQPSSVAFAQLAMVPLPQTGPVAGEQIAVAVVYLPPILVNQLPPPPELYYLVTTTTGTVLSQELLSRGVDPNQPVKLAVGPKGKVLVTWVELNGGAELLVGEFIGP